MTYVYTHSHYEELNNIVYTGSKWVFCAGAFNLIPYGEMRVVFARDTFEIKEILKASGARWNREERNWWIPVTDAAMADRIIRRAAYADRIATEAGRKDAAKAWAKAWCEWTPAPKTYKINLAKLAQAAAAHLAAAAQAKAAAAVRKISLRPVVAAAVKGAAHAVRSARARKGWETRRKNAAAKAEILNAKCEPMAAADVTAECCDGTPAHGAEGRVVTAYVGGPIDEWSDVRHDWMRMAHTEDQYCERGTIVTNGKDDVQILVDHKLRRVDTSRCARVWPCDATDTYPVRVDAPCLTPAEGRRERRNARRREIYRQRHAA